MSEYIRKDENGAKVTPQIFTLPFSYKNTSFGLNVDESELFSAGFVRYLQSDLRIPPLKMLDYVKFKDLGNNQATFEPVLRQMNEAEQIAQFGSLLDLQGWKKEYIKAFNEYANKAYTNYLSKYPDLEQSTFSQKANEAFKVKLDENTPLNETPFLSFLAGESLEARNALAQAIIAKVAYITKFESFCVKKREERERAGSRELLTHIIIDMSDFTA